MPRPLGHIRILLSSRVLLDLNEANRIFQEKKVGEYNDYVRARGKYKADYDPNIGGRRFSKGPMWDFAEAALKLNAYHKDPVIEIGLVCKDDKSSALPIFRNLDVYGLEAIDYRIVIGEDEEGQSKRVEMDVHEEFGTDLFLTYNPEDAQIAVDNGIASSTIYTSPDGFNYQRKKPDGPLVWAIDGDAVAFGSSSEVRYRREGLKIYRELEKRDFDQTIEPGPFTAILGKISALNESIKDPRKKPFRLTLITARGGDSSARVLTIAESHGIDFNGGMRFLGGAAKAHPLKILRPDLFNDDQTTHLQESTKYCPTGLVAYAKGGPMYEMVQEVKAAEAAASTTSSFNGAVVGDACNAPDSLEALGVVKGTEPGPTPR